MLFSFFLDLILLIRPTSVAVYCSNTLYSYLLPYIGHWQNLDVYCLKSTIEVGLLFSVLLSQNSLAFNVLTWFLSDFVCFLARLYPRSSVVLTWKALIL